MFSPKASCTPQTVLPSMYHSILFRRRRLGLGGTGWGGGVAHRAAGGRSDMQRRGVSAQRPRSSGGRGRGGLPLIRHLADLRLSPSVRTLIGAHLAEVGLTKAFQIPESICTPVKCPGSAHAPYERPESFSAPELLEHH